MRAAACSPAGSHTKLACGSGTDSPIRRRSSLATRSRSVTTSATRVAQLVVGRQRGERRRLADPVDGEGHQDLVDGAHHVGVREHVADAQGGEPVGLREGAQHGEVGLLGQEGQGIRGVAAGDVLVVRLVEHDQAAGGHGIEERHSSSWPTTVPVGLFGEVTNTTRVRSVTAAAMAAMSRAWKRLGTGDLGGAHDRGVDRVGLEAAPAVQHLVARIGVGQQDLLQEAHRSAADADLVDAQPETVGQGGAQLAGAVVGVAVEGGGGRAVDGGEHRRQRRERVLVRGQLDGRVQVVVGHGDLGRAARLVHGQRGQCRAGLGGGGGEGVVGWGRGCCRHHDAPGAYPAVDGRVPGSSPAVRRAHRGRPRGGAAGPDADRRRRRRSPAGARHRRR